MIQTIKATCPVCGRADTVARLSAIYIAGVELKLPGRVSANSEPTYQVLQSHQPWKQLSKTDLIDLSKRFSPPSSGRQSTTRPIHPDLVVLVFALVAPFFIYGIYTTQTSALAPILAVLSVLLWLYVWKRRTLITRYKAQVEAQHLADQRTKTAIERWLKLNYCLEDDLVFDSERGASLPADQYSALLSE